MTSGIIILTYSYLLIKIDRDYRLIVAIAVMVIIGNFSSIGVASSAAVLADNRGKNFSSFDAWNTIYGFSVILNTAFAQLPNWVFAFEYFKIARTMPFVLANQEVPPEMVKRHQRTFRFFICFIVMFSVITGFS